MVSTEAKGSNSRARSGVPGLDGILEGGFPAGRAILVCGRAGTGKTTLAAQFLAQGLGQDEPGVLVSVDQKPRHLLHDAARFGWGLEEAAGRKRLLLLDAAPYFTAAGDPRRRLDARQLASDLARQVREVGARRLVIDGMPSLVPDGLAPAQSRDFLRSVIFAMEDNLGCTTVLTSAHDEALAPCADVARAAEELVSGIVELRVHANGAGQLERRLVVRKMRGTAAPLVERRFAILDGQGLVLEG
jgi:KaiC/GvpD/RAD55 family RecA-like ATPase